MDRYTRRDRDTPQVATIHLDKRRIQTWVGTLLSMLFSVGAGAGTMYVGQKTVDNEQAVQETKSAAQIAESTALVVDREQDKLGRLRAAKDQEHDTEIRVLKERYNDLLQFVVATRSSQNGRRVSAPKPVDPRRPAAADAGPPADPDPPTEE